MSVLQSLKISDEISSWKITWTIKKFLCFAHDRKFSLDSPAFAISGAVWRLRMYRKFKKKNNYLSISLIRSESQFSSHQFSITMKLRGYLIDPGITDAVTFEDGKDSVALRSVHYGDLVLYRSSFMPNNTLVLQFTLSNVTGIQEKKALDISSETVEAHVKLAEDLKNLVLSETDSDVIIRVKGQVFPAHKAIIRVRSPVFAAMLRSEMKEKASGIVDIENLDPDVFPDFLSFLYTGSVIGLSEKNVFGLYTAADMYDVRELKSSCVQFMRCCLSAETFCDVVSISLLHNEEELLDEAMGYFSKNMVDILQTATWEAFLGENLSEGNALLIKALEKK